MNRIRLAFQHLALGSTKPNESILAGSYTEISDGTIIPSPGDIIQMQVINPPENRGNIRSFKVLARNYFYVTPTLENITQCTITIVVADAQDTEVGANLA